MYKPTRQSMAIAVQRRVERHRRFLGYKSADIQGMNTDELEDYAGWVHYQMVGAVGSKYAYLDLLADMVQSEMESR